MLAPSLNVTSIQLHALVGDAVLVACDGDEAGPPMKLTPAVGGKPVPRPYSSLTVPTSWGGRRSVIALRWPKSRDAADGLTLRDGDRVVAELDADTGLRRGRLNAQALLAGLGSAARLKVIGLLLDFCRAAFARSNEAQFADLVRACLTEAFPAATALTPRVEVTAELTLCEGLLPRAFGPVTRLLAVGRRQVRVLPFKAVTTPGAAPAGQTRLHVMLEAEAGEEELLVVLQGTNGMACRRVSLSGAPRRPLLDWLERAKPAVLPALRDYVGACLAARAGESAQAAALLKTMQVLSPLPTRTIFGKTRPVGAGIDFAISHHADGLFVSGWINDSHDLVEGLRAISPLGEVRDLTAPLHRFARPDVAEHYGQPANGDLSGFATFLPGAGNDGAIYQHRFELRLRSGASLTLVPPLPPLNLAEARNAVLGSIPPSYLTPEAMETCIAPAAGSLHAAYMATKAAPEVIRFGQAPEKPVVSFVIPLYRNLDFLRFQMAAFAIDPAMADVELIYVLDSPEQRREVEHLLLGLHGLYALPVTLLVMSANYGFAAASNAGGWAARGRNVLFLNSDVVPDMPGWLAPLLAAMDSALDVGAVGPKLLFDDQSLQHAGMFFGKDLRGLWMNQHYYKGLPRDFAPANIARPVPAVTGAAVMTRRDIFEAVGGFSEDYIIGDYEDSDFCLKIREAGFDIRYVPTAELYHLERQSIRRHTGYMRGVACDYNRRLHIGRWDKAMAELMDGAQSLPGRRQPPSAISLVPLAGAAE